MKTPLRAARERRGLTIQEVAIAIESDVGNLSRIERGLQVPTKPQVERLVEFFGGDVSETQIIWPERFSEAPAA